MRAFRALSDALQMSDCPAQGEHPITSALLVSLAPSDPPSLIDYPALSHDSALSERFALSDPCTDTFPRIKRSHRTDQIPRSERFLRTRQSPPPPLIFSPAFSHYPANCYPPASNKGGTKLHLRLALKKPPKYSHSFQLCDYPTLTGSSAHKTGNEQSFATPHY